MKDINTAINKLIWFSWRYRLEVHAVGKLYAAKILYIYNNVNNEPENKYKSYVMYDAMEPSIADALYQLKHNIIHGIYNSKANIPEDIKESHQIIFEHDRLENDMLNRHLQKLKVSNSYKFRHIPKTRLTRKVKINSY